MTVILKVSQLNSLSRKILEANFSAVLVTGEISNLVEPSSGHLYFSLKDETAQVRAVMFSRSKTTLRFHPENGMHVVVTAKVSLYEPRGDYQLIVEQMEESGIGVLHTKFLQLKTKLAAEGLFDAKYKKPLPKLPQTIGVITSPTGAVIRDILSVLKRRFPSVNVIIYPVQVQGNEAAKQLVTALENANTRKECEVLILARGGGSIEDLWSFNEEAVARAIFASRIPIVSAVGHETDFTIADFVADVRAPTPSVAAELVVPDMFEWCNVAENLKHRLINLMRHKLQQINWQLTNLRHRLRHPGYYLERQMQHLDDMERRLHLALRYQLNYWQERLGKIGAALNLVSPLATIARCYAVITRNKKVVHKVTEVVVGDRIQAKLIDGELDCVVEGVKT